MDLKSLKPSLSELQRDAALAIILQIRASRGQNKRIVKERAKERSTVNASLRSLSIEQLEALVQNLDKGGRDD